MPEPLRSCTGRGPRFADHRASWALVHTDPSFEFPAPVRTTSRAVISGGDTCAGSITCEVAAQRAVPRITPRRCARARRDGPYYFLMATLTNLFPTKSSNPSGDTRPGVSTTDRLTPTDTLGVVAGGDTSAANGEASLGSNQAGKPAFASTYGTSAFQLATGLRSP